MLKKLILIGMVLALCMVLPAAATVADGACEGPVAEERATALAVITANDFVTQDYEKAADLIAGGGNPKSAKDVGDVMVDVDCAAKTLMVKYVIEDLTPLDAFDNWFLTETHLAVTNQLDAEGDPAVPQAKNNPIPGQFEYSNYHDYLTEYTYTVDISDFLDADCDAPIYIAAHAVVKDPCGLEGIELALPETVTLVVDYYDSEEPTYFDITLSNDGFLNGAYDAWCVDVGHYIYEGYLYTGTSVYSSYEDLPPTVNVDNPENFDKVNWIINHISYGDTLTDQYGAPIPGTVTMCDIQRAIWTLIDDQIADCGSYSQARVDEIVREANLHGDGYTPGCNDILAIVLVPLHTDGVPDDPPYNPPQVIIGQVIIGQGSVPCDMCRSETAWGALKIFNSAGKLTGFNYPFSGKNWATWFQVTPDCCVPTVTEGPPTDFTKGFGVRYRGLPLHSLGDEIYLGVGDLGVGANRAQRNFGYTFWASTNGVTFTFDRTADKETTAVDLGNNGGVDFTLEYPSLASQMVAKTSCTIDTVDKMEILVKAAPGVTLNFNNVLLDGYPLGSFSNAGTGDKFWTVTDFDFTQSFTITGIIDVTGTTAPTNEQNRVEMLVGCPVPPSP